MPLSPAELLSLTDAMKSRGVKSFSLDGVAVEFAPAEPAVPSASKEKPADEKCRCGHHSDDEHMMGLCIKGCDPTKCAPEEAKG